MPSSWQALLDSGAGAELEFERVPFDHPLWVLYSSGTTGLPKPIVQGQGGILLEHLKKLNLHIDAQAGDRFFWFTTTGWMMWNFLVSGLLTRPRSSSTTATPGTPTWASLWDLAEQAGIDLLRHQGQLHRRLHEGRSRARRRAATSRRCARSARPARRSPRRASTGSTTTSAPTPGCSRPRGGTDVCTAFVGGCPLLPVYRGELQARALGAKVEAFDEDGNSVIDEVGELVITEPMPSMPVGFWGDEDGSRYRASLLRACTPASGATATGSRSPRAAPRSSTAARTRPSTAAASAWGRARSTARCRPCPRCSTRSSSTSPAPEPKAGCRCSSSSRDGAELDDELVAEIKRRIRDHCSPRHVPNEIFAIAEVPRTLSGKVLEVPVKRILTGTPAEQAASRDSLANPAALDCFVELSSKLDSRRRRRRVRRGRAAAAQRALGDDLVGAAHDRALPISDLRRRRRSPRRPTRRPRREPGLELAEREPGRVGRTSAMSAGPRFERSPRAAASAARRDLRDLGRGHRGRVGRDRASGAARTSSRRRAGRASCCEPAPSVPIPSATPALSRSECGRPRRSRASCSRPAW